MTLPRYNNSPHYGELSPIGRKAISLLILVLGLSVLPARAQSVGQPAASDATSTTSSSEILDRAHKSTERLFEESANLHCTENVTQSVLDRFDRPMYEERARFDYRFLVDHSSRSINFVESRQQIQAPFHDPGRTVLMTDGFGNMILILHPAYAANYIFESEGEEVLDGVRANRFRFRSQPNSSSPLMLQIRGRNYSVALNGTVWIEPRTGTILKLIAISGSEMGEWGIHNIKTEIEYQPVKLDDDGPYWMPASAVIDVETSKRHWRNVHLFTSYKRFQPALSAAQDK